MDKTAPKYVRRQYLVAKKFQLKYVGLILLLMFLTAAFFSYLLFYTTLLFQSKLLMERETLLLSNHCLILQRLHFLNIE